MQDYEIRKHYEAAITDLALFFNVYPIELRGDMKNFLIKKKIIALSTSELYDEQLKRLADQISIFVSRMEKTPPAERGVLEERTFEAILKIEPKKHDYDKTTND